MNTFIRYIFVLFLILAVTACGEKSIQVVNLLCDYSENPLAIHSENPLLGWQLISDKKAQNQSAYRILVSSSLSLLENEQGDYWDSGKILSSETSVKYQGKKLGSRTPLYWKVMVWDKDDMPSDWSNVASWRMGILEPSGWQAKWIGQMEDLSPESPETFPAPYFRKEFTLTKSIKEAIAYVSGLGFYEMYINGNKIGDQVLAPAVTNYDERSLKNLLYHYDDQSTQRVFYNVFDVTNQLNTQNAIGILLGNGWYNQRDRIVEGHMWYDVPKMILQLEIEYNDGTKETVVSDNSWKTTTGPLVHNAIFTGEIYDARLDLGAWSNPSYDDETWIPAMVVRPPTGRLEMQTVPFNKVMRTVNTDFEQINDSLYRFTLPETVSGWCSIDVKGNPGDTVKVRFISEEGLDYQQIDTYILKGGGSEKWEPRFTWHTFREIEILTKNVEISKQSVIVKSIYTDVDKAGEFECSNELFNRINQSYVRTMHANFKGIISSDPHRERLAYTGDAQVIVQSLLYSFDMTRFMRKMFNDIEDARNKKTGYVPHTTPFGGGGGGPAWGSAYVIMPWAYFQHYGDKTVLEEHYKGMKQWVEYLSTRTDERGIVVREEPNGWCLGEWCTLWNIVEIPAPLVNTAYYYHVTSIMAEVAKILDKKEDATELLNLTQSIKDNFNAAFYNPVTNNYWEGRQGSNVFPLAFGLVPDGEHEKVFAALIEQLHTTHFHFDTGILATPLLLKVLTENGKADIAYQLMDQRDFPGYGYLMDDKNSTLWEVWDGGGEDPDGSGHCHPMFGSVVAWFYHSLAGIKPDNSNPGMKHFYIEPHLVPDLNYCKASYNTLYGKITSGWEIDKNGHFHLTVEVPVNTSATIIFPDWGNKNTPTQQTVSSGSYKFTIYK